MEKRGKNRYKNDKRGIFILALVEEMMYNVCVKLGTYRVCGKRMEQRGMGHLQRNFSFILAAISLLQLLAGSASAATGSVTGYSRENQSVTIDLTQGNEEHSDFVTSFPKVEIKKKLKAIRPSPELAKQKRKEYVSVPSYYQDDYPDILYGDGTVKTSGCSITAISMVATYLTGYEYLPNELAYYFGGRAVNNMERLENAAKTLQLPYTKPKNWDFTFAALKEGKIAIVLVSENSKFTDTQHFIVLTGVTEDDKVLVNDPLAENYKRWDLKQGFASGFPATDIINGYQGAWVFDKTAMPEEITRYFEEPPVLPELRYPEIDLSFAEMQMIARVVWVESRGEPAEGQQAVAEVVLNRLASDQFPDELREVIYGKDQFRSAPFLKDALPGQAQYKAVENAIYGPYVLPKDVTYFARTAVNDNVWGEIGGHVFCYSQQDE